MTASEPTDPDHGDPDHGDPDHGDPDHGNPDHGDPAHNEVADPSVDETTLMDLSSSNDEAVATDLTTVLSDADTAANADAGPGLEPDTPDDEEVEATVAGTSDEEANYWRPGVRLDARVVPTRAAPAPPPPRRTGLIAAAILLIAVLLTVAIVLFAWSRDDSSSSPSDWSEIGQLASP